MVRNIDRRGVERVVVKRRFIVDESKGNLPYMIVWVSKGGWLSTEQIDSYTGLLKRKIALEALGLNPILFFTIRDITKVEELRE